jgi:Kef-type K+ transport system membrane component KefB
MKFFNWINKFLEESPQVYSSIRLQMLASFLFCALIPALVWAGLSIAEKKLLDFPAGAATFFIAIITATSTSKIIQYWKENSTSTTSAPTNTSSGSLS